MSPLFSSSLSPLYKVASLESKASAQRRSRRGKIALLGFEILKKESMPKRVRRGAIPKPRPFVRTKTVALASIRRAGNVQGRAETCCAEVIIPLFMGEAIHRDLTSAYQQLYY